MLMRGVNPAFAAAQLGHSLQMFLQVYAKWIHGDQNKSEFQKIKQGQNITKGEAL
jgi:integrase